MVEWQNAIFSSDWKFCCCSKSQDWLATKFFSIQINCNCWLLYVFLPSQPLQVNAQTCSVNVVSLCVQFFWNLWLFFEFWFIISMTLSDSNSHCYHAFIVRYIVWYVFIVMLHTNTCPMNWIGITNAESEIKVKKHPFYINFYHFHWFLLFLCQNYVIELPIRWRPSFQNENQQLANDWGLYILYVWCYYRQICFIKSWKFDSVQNINRIF